MNSAKNQRFVPPDGWDGQILQSHPAYRPLCQSLPLAALDDFPSPELLTQWLQERHPTLTGRFVDAQVLTADGRYYEVFIADSGQIPTRPANWHDFFGALCWLLFPKSKAALNQRHLQEIVASTSTERSALRHQLTLFDECGVLLLHHEAQRPQVAALRQHQWQQAMQHSAASWQGTAGLWPLIFGHANYEMLTRPFIGLTAKLWPIEVSRGFYQWPLRQQIDFVDTVLSEQIASFSLTAFKGQMSPLPLLGIPGWFPNQTAAFYQDQQYFRPKRQQVTAEHGKAEHGQPQPGHEKDQPT